MSSPFISRNTFSILFFIHRSKTNKDGEHPIYCRLTVQGKPRMFSTQLWCVSDKWIPEAGKVKGTNEKAVTINNSLESTRLNLLNIRTDLQAAGKLITAEIVINIHLGKIVTNRTLCQLHDYFNENHVKPLLGKDYANGTYERYKTSFSHIKEFMLSKYGIKDIALNELSYAFANDYEFYLKTVRECSHNTAAKYVKNLKAVVNYAVSQEWITTNPLARYRGKLERIDKEFLTEYELRKIESKVFDNERLEEV